MNILITGGTGLIGQALTRQLLNRGEQLTLLTRNPQKATLLFPKTIRFITALSELSTQDKFDAIINLAGEPIFHRRWSKKQKARLRDSRLNLTKELVQWINHTQHNPIFISGSASGIYGDQKAEIITEESQTTHTFAAQLCQDWENAANQAQARICIVRIGMVFSQKGGALAKMLPVYKMGLGGKLSCGTQYFPWIALEDVVKGLIFLLENPSLQGVFNLSAPSPITQEKLNRLLAQKVKRPAFSHAPACALQLILGERASLLLESQNMLPQKLLHAGFQFDHPQCETYLSTHL